MRLGAVVCGRGHSFCTAYLSALPIAFGSVCSYPRGRLWSNLAGSGGRDGGCKRREGLDRSSLRSRGSRTGGGTRLPRGAAGVVHPARGPGGAAQLDGGASDRRAGVREASRTPVSAGARCLVEGSRRVAGQLGSRRFSGRPWRRGCDRPHALQSSRGEPVVLPRSCLGPAMPTARRFGSRRSPSLSLPSGRGSRDAIRSTCRPIAAGRQRVWCVWGLSGRLSWRGDW